MPAPFVVAGMTVLLSFLTAVFKKVLDWLVNLMTKRGIGIAFFLTSASAAFLVSYQVISSLASAAAVSFPSWSNYLLAVLPSNFLIVVSSIISIEFTAFLFRWGYKVIDLKTDAMIR
jgi:hypothetical protein